MTKEIDAAAEAMKEQISKMMQSFKLPDVDMTALVEGQRKNIDAMAADLAERGCVTPSGRPYSASAIASMLGEGSPGYRRGDRLEKRLITGISARESATPR